MTKILNHLMGAAILATLLTAGTALAQERAQADVQIQSITATQCRRFKDDSHHHDPLAAAECRQDLQRVRLEHDARSPTEQQLPGNHGHALISGGELVRKVAKQWGGSSIPQPDFQRPVRFDPSLSIGKGVYQCGNTA